jgi:hypothetical protein
MFKICAFMLGAHQRGHGDLAEEMDLLPKSSSPSSAGDQ